jgi:hypothetical protein
MACSFLHSLREPGGAKAKQQSRRTSSKSVLLDYPCLDKIDTRRQPEILSQIDRVLFNDRILQQPAGTIIYHNGLCFS